MSTKIKHTLLTLLILSAFISCTSSNDKLLGSWDNKEGQILEFEKDSQAKWIFYTETTSDTFQINYNANFNTKPIQIDLTNFKAGPLKGKTLFGIIEFTNDSTMRFDCEPLLADRPKDFNSEQTKTYFKLK